MMSKVIGGEFSISEEQLFKNECVDIKIDTSSGRTALFFILEHIAKKNKNNKILLPSYLCDSITKAVIDAGWEYDFFQIDENLRIDLSKLYNLSQYSTILLINYFGMIDLKDDITFLKKQSPDLIIIEDDVQAFYELNNSIADYSFCSLRKWFPCPDGALVLPRDVICSKHKKAKWSQYKLAGNLLKSYSSFIDDCVALDLLNKGEQLLEEDYICEASDASKIIYSNLNFNEIANKRKNNAIVLHNELEKIGINHMYNKESVPLFIPIFVKDRDKLRKIYFDNNIYTPKHWPKTNDVLNGQCTLYDNELSLICDQRYNEKDMLTQIRILKDFFNVR